jgi:hypothetical protein
MILGCPILEDELVYGIMNDDEKKDILLIETEPSQSLIRKFERNIIPYTVMNENEFLANGTKGKSSGFSIVIKMLDMALHREPEILRKKIEEEVMKFSEVSDVMALYYGMCGNYGWDITEWAKENNLCPVLVFRDRRGNVCDDCVAVAVGGTEKYRELLRAHTGRMYFTPGVAVNWNDFLAANEMFGGCWGGSVERLKWIFEQCNYDSVVQIDTGLGDYEEMCKSTKEFADTYEFRIIEAEDYWPDLYPAQKLYNDAKNAMNSEQSGK